MHRNNTRSPTNSFLTTTTDHQITPYSVLPYSSVAAVLADHWSTFRPSKHWLLALDWIQIEAIENNMQRSVQEGTNTNFPTLCPSQIIRFHPTPGHTGVECIWGFIVCLPWTLQLLNNSRCYSCYSVRCVDRCAAEEQTAAREHRKTPTGWHLGQSCVCSCYYYYFSIMRLI